jgi:N-glycosylase/DNA lyase
MNLRYKHIDELQSEFKQKKNVIRKRLNDFKTIPPELYFYELCYCLMTPQSSAINAGKAQAMLELHNFQHSDVHPEMLLHQKEYYVRFHKTKARHLLGMKMKYEIIFSIVNNTMPVIEKREQLVRNVKGLSYKEATHFLRNIGKNENLAILDRHILKNLCYHGVIRSIPKTLTKPLYAKIEKAFQRFAAAINITVNELDLVFWSREAGDILK